MTTSPTKDTLDYAHGFVVLVKGNVAMDTHVISWLTSIGCKWLRLQVNWSDVEQVQGQYTTTTWDDAIPRLNAAGINVCLPIQNPPLFHKTLACGTSGTLPDPNAVIAFTKFVIDRYNGGAHGTIQAVEYNEDYDNYRDGNTGDANYACRTPASFGAVLKTIYPYAKQVNPKLLVGSAALLGRRQSIAHISEWVTTLYASAGGDMFDYLNVHYYPCGVAYTANDPTPNGVPSFVDILATMKAASAAAGHPNKDIWLTEYNWKVATATQVFGLCQVADASVQAAYTQALLDYCRTNGVTHAFWWTIGAKTEDSSITQGDDPTSVSFLPVWNTIKADIAAHPTFVTPITLPPSITDHFIAALLPLLPAGTKLAAESSDGSGRDRIYTDKAHMLAHAQYPCALVTQGDTPLTAYVDYYDLWDEHATVAYELDRMVANIIDAHTATSTLMLVQHTISDVFKETDAPSPSLRTRRLTLVFAPVS